MKKIEITLRSTTAELEKLIARKERAEKKLAKAEAKVDQLNCRWTNDEHREFLNNVESVDGWMTNKEEIKRNGAWYDWIGAKRELEDVTERIEKASTRVEKAQQEVEEYLEEVRKIEDVKEKERLWKLEFEEEQKEWAKDGITLDGRYNGKTPNGKPFGIWGNNGVTERSRHCFTLYIDREVIFTSGEFWRCYMEIKRR